MKVLFWLLMASQAILCRLACLSKSCNCGYGALQLGEKLEWACSQKYCAQFSGLFYQPDCSTILNLCLSSPCKAGKCVQTFGNFFCECPPGLVGKLCHIPRADLWKAGAHSKFYVYYQVQSGKKGERVRFHVIYDQMPNEQFEDSGVNGIRLLIQTQDKRFMFPSVKTSFRRVNVKKRCLDDARRHPEWQDIDVCSLVPGGDVWTYSFNPSYELPSGVDVLDPDGVKIGETGRLEVIHFWIENSTIRFELGYSAFTLFTYKVYRAPNPCKLSTSITFDGCSGITNQPYMHNRYEIIKITPVIKQDLLACKGSITVGKSWYIQRNVNEYTGHPDTEPGEYLDSKNIGTLTLPPHELPDGVHSIEYRITYRGDPPNYGGLSIFHSYGRCWIRVILGLFVAQMKGGRDVTASCYAPYELRVESLNPSYLPTELSFLYFCDQPKDKECAMTSSDVPVITKLVTPCDTVYTFAIKVNHRLIRPAETIVVGIVHFKRIDFGFRMQCLFNCFPIDVSWRMLTVAITEPYTEDTLTWKMAAILSNQSVAKLHSNLPNVDAFWPFVTSRILRVDGNKFVLSYEKSPKIVVESKMAHWPAKADIVMWTMHNAEINRCELFVIPEGKAVFGCPPDYVVFGDTVYSVIETNKLTKTNTEILETHYINQLVVQPVERTLQLCVSIPPNVHMCAREREYQGELIGIDRSIQGLLDSWSSTAVRPILRLFSLLLYAKVWSPYGFFWRMSCDERKKLIERLQEVEHWRKPAYILSACNILSMIFYSKAGNRIEGIGEFVDEIDSIQNYHQFEKWREMRSSALKLLLTMSEWAYKFAAEGKVKKLPTFSYGNMLDVLLRSWSLAHVQGSTDTTYLFYRFKFYRHFRWLLTSIEFHRQTDNKILFQIAHKFSKAIAVFSNLFYGIRSYGRHHVRAWSLRSTYRGIVQSFNKSKRGETLPELANHIFAPVYPGGEWVGDVHVKLPKGRILPGKELCFSVLLIQNRPGDNVISPTIFMHLSDASGEAYTSLPHKAEFTVTLPVLIGGHQLNFASEHFFSDTLVRREIRTHEEEEEKGDDEEEEERSQREEEQRNFNIFKIVLPGKFQEWQLSIYVKFQVPLKLSISSGALPSFDRVNELQPLEPSLLPNSHNFYYLDYPVKPLPGKTQLSKYFYLAVMLDSKFPTEVPVEFFLKQSVDVCENRDPLLKNPKTLCKGLMREKKRDYKHRMDCVCNQFGFISGVVDSCRITRVFTKPIAFVAPSRTIQNHILLFSTTIVTIIVMGLAYWKDRNREKRTTIQMIEDANRTDQTPLVLGIYTGKRFFSGTNSMIAIKIVGLSSSSRVHLLKSKMKKTLQTASDDWFLITTSQPLGRIVSITMWSNYCQSAWYCTRVLIYDVKQTIWYIVPVNSWLGLHPTKNTSRVMSLPARKISPLESKLKAMPNKFREHYVTEFRNTHFFWSQFWLHERNLSTHEERSSIFLVKCFSMLFCVLLCVWVVSPNTFSESLEDTSSGILYTQRSLTTDFIITCCIVVTCSYVIVLPFVLGIRVGLKSFAIQKKTTNSIYLGSIGATHDHQKFDSQKVTHVVSGSIGKSDKSVAFILDANEGQGQQPIVTVAKPPPGKIRKQRIAAASHSSLKYWLKLLIGPTQFRAVNVSYGVFQIKMSRRKLMFRVVVSVVLLFCLLGVFIIEEHTKFWDNYRLYGGICLFSLVIDVIIFNPLLIFLKSAMNILVLKTSNRELYLWNEDAKLANLPQPLSHEVYCKTATAKDYKPMLTQDIEKLREKSVRMELLESVVQYVVLFAVFAVCYNILHFKYDNDHYHTINTLQTTYRSAKNFLTDQTTNAEHIVEDLQLEPFITATLLNLVNSWPDGKLISADRKRWCRDRVSKIVGGTSMVISFASTRKTNNIPYLFCKYYDVAVGSLATSEVQTKSIVIDDTLLMYRIVDGQTTVRGKSGEMYNLVGHNFVASSEKWSKYCVTVANLVLGSMSRNDSEETPRAMILSSNFINAFSRRLNTIDVIIEFLPAGIISAKVIATSLKVFSKTYISNYIRRIFLLLFGVMFSAFVVMKILKTSFNDFRKSSFWKLVVMTSVIVVIITFFIGYVSKYKMIRRFFNAPSEVYVDLHQANALNYIDSASLSIFFLCLCIEFSILLRRLLVKHRFPLAMHDGLRSYLVVILMLFIYVRVLEICCRPLNPSARNFILVNYNIKAVFPLKLDACLFEEFVLLALLFALLLSKFATATLVFHTDKAMEELDSKEEAWAWHKLWSKRSKKAPTTSEVDPDDRVVMRLMRRSRTKSVKSSIAEKTRVARLGEKIDFLKRLW